jgi:hypothetical protein
MIAVIFSVRPFALAAPASVDSSSQESSPYSILGPWTLSAGFPQGGSIWGSPALSARNEVSQGDFLTIGLQLSSDRKEKSESAAVFAKWNHMLSNGSGRSFPYAFLQSGYLVQKANEETQKESSAVFATGLGVEVSLLPEISTSLEVGWGGILWPASQFSYAAATTQLAIHYHFQL